MAFLRRLVGGGSKRGPDWAGGMTADEYEAFSAAVRAELERRGASVEFIDEGGGVRSNLGRAAGEEPATFGLSNLAQLAHVAGREQWGRLIAQHFDTMTRGDSEDRELVGERPDFDRIRSLLKVRLYPSDYRDAAPGATWVARTLAPGLLAVLVYDLPSTVRTVPAEEAERWPLGHAGLFELGLRNVREGDPVERNSMPVEGGTPITAIVGDHFFAASHALLLEEHLGPELPHGALVSVPHRHAVLAAPVLDLGIVHTLNTLIVVGNAMHHEGPGSISPSLYWWRGGTFAELPSRFDGRKVQFAPPESFVEVLNRLPPAA